MGRGGGKGDTGKGGMKERGEGQREWEGRQRTWDGTGREEKGKEGGGGESEERGYSPPPEFQYLALPVITIRR